MSTRCPPPLPPPPTSVPPPLLPLTAHLLHRARLSSDSDPEEGDGGLFPFPLPKEGGSRGSSEDSEEEGAADDAHRPDCHYAARPPRPQAVSWVGRPPLRCGGGRGGGVTRSDPPPPPPPIPRSSAPLGAAWSARAATSSTGGWTASARLWAPCWSGTSARTCGGDGGGLGEPGGPQSHPGVPLSIVLGGHRAAGGVLWAGGAPGGDGVVVWGGPIWEESGDVGGSQWAREQILGGGVLYVKGAVGGTQGVGDPIGKGAEIRGAKEQ